MILAANRCRDRSPNFYVADSISEVGNIISPRLGDVAVLASSEDLVFWRLMESDAEPDGVDVIESGSCGYMWLISGGSGGSSGIAGLFSGIGSPEGVQAGAVGSHYTDLTDTQHPAVWLKTSGGSTSVGWVQAYAI